MMRYFCLISIQVLVLVSTEDYGTVQADYSDEDSDSVSLEVVQNETVSNEATRNEAARNEAARNEAARNEAARNEAARNEAVRNEAVNVETEGITVTTTIPTRRRRIDNSTTDAVTPGTTEDPHAEESARRTMVNYPFVASIQKKGSHYATGALLNEKWIITSAGEFYHVRESIKLFRARLGSVDCKRGGKLVPLKRVEIHPSYRVGEPSCDVSLLRLATPVEYTSFIRPIGMSKITTRVVSANFLTLYWPRLIVHNRILPKNAKERHRLNSLRVSTQKMIPREQCEKRVNLENVFLQNSAMCLKPFITHHSICTPDAGAPVVAEDGLWGITSGWTSKNCPSQPSPTVFTRLALVEISAWVDTEILLAL